MTDKALALLEGKGKLLDETAEKFGAALDTPRSPFSGALLLSRGIRAMRELLDEDIMREFMQLADSPLGFLTDRAPGSEAARKYGAYKPADIKDAIIEASLRGFRPAGNEFNIISGRFYAAKAGLHRKVISFPGVTNFSETFGVPKMVGDKGAVVAAKATWLKYKAQQELSRDFAIRVNAMMGVDAIIGKAQRKLYSAVLNQLQGIVTPDGEVDEPKDAPQQEAEEPRQVPQGQADLKEKDSEPTKLDALKDKMSGDNITAGELLEIAKRAKAPADSLEELTEYFVTQMLEDWENVVAQCEFIRAGG